MTGAQPGSREPERVPISRSTAERAEEERFLALYGPWAPLRPDQIAAELDGFERPWWVVGGWAIEAATGYRREHEDTDISLLACDVPAFVAHLSDRWHIWNNTSGVLRPLTGDQTAVTDPRSQLWLRAGATAPWVLDVPLTPDQDGLWTNKVLPGHVAPVESVTWQDSQGIRYLRPEFVLAYKARLRRPKDDPDFEAALPVLSRQQGAWLQSALAATAPDHPWRDRLQAAPGK